MQVSKCEKCGRIVAEPKELIRIQMISVKITNATPNDARAEKKREEKN